MSRSVAKALLSLLLAAVLAVPLAAAVFPPPADAHPAGCHEDGQNAPTPSPTSHQCCQVGHDAAIPQRSATLRASLQISTLMEFNPHKVAVAVPLQNIAVTPGDPPITPPLRI